MATLILGIAAFVLPGYFVAVALKSRAQAVATFILSLLILFTGVFWIEVAGGPIRFGTILTYELVCCVAAGVWAWKSGSLIEKSVAVATDGGKDGWQGRLLIGGAAIVVLILLLRSALVPLTGPDTVWRWDFLAQQILKFGHFRFYPPVSGEDFRFYSYCDPLAPLVSVSYWWLYASWGEHWAALTSLLVTAQLAAVMQLTYGTAEGLSSSSQSPRAGALAVGVLAGSFLMYFSVVIGQETGLTALSMAGVLYFLIASDRDDWRAMVLAGSAAALGALSREYGGAFVAIGLVVAIWTGKNARSIVVYLIVAGALVAPWYVRTWIRTGNPFYSTFTLGIFPGNRVFGEINQNYVRQLGLGAFDSERTWAVAKWLMWTTPLQLFIGIPALLLLARRQGYLLVAWIVVVVLWLMSLGYTANPMNATRVLSPALVVASIAIGVACQRFVKSRTARVAILIVVMGGICYAALADLVYPARLSDAPVGRWPELALSTWQRQWVDPEIKEVIEQALPDHARILSTHLGVHALLKDSDHPVVPIWSPEVSFVFDQKADVKQITRRLVALNIRAVWFDHGDLNESMMMRYPFYAQGLKRWKPVAARGGSVLYLISP